MSDDNAHGILALPPMYRQLALMIARERNNHELEIQKELDAMSVDGRIASAIKEAHERKTVEQRKADS